MSAISEAANVATTELSTPLDEVVDADGLVQLLSNGDETIRVTFQYQQYVVEAHGDGVVEVTDSGGGD
ncbi:hypothetical protein HUG12_16850 [Halorarum salinum]|uniref:Halobacterial output domain-containing protein n=1 Tax=Halorarum salinum TaxID=2743089 RepID=A0A7D5LCK3_9EURY|nr:hypothetical protein HUG12_16850 [Halobaculum salinum]